MDQNGNKNGRGVVVFFLLCLLMAAVCFGVFGGIYASTRGAAPVDQRVVEISKIVVLTGILFLVIAFGYALPAMIRGRKSRGGSVATDEDDIFNEANMRAALEQYIPAGEALLAGIHVVTKESSVRYVFDQCVLREDELRFAQDGKTISVHKAKYAAYDMYLGITQRSLVAADCKKYRYAYEFNEVPRSSAAKIQTVAEPVALRDLGKCFSLDEIESCEVKNGLSGSLNCIITLKNGDYFKIMMPKTGGLGGGMPRHGEYRDAILACLSLKQHQ